MERERAATYRLGELVVIYEGQEAIERTVAVIKVHDAAQGSLRIAMFDITNPAVIAVLENAAARGVIYLVTDRGQFLKERKHVLDGLRCLSKYDNVNMGAATGKTVSTAGRMHMILFLTPYLTITVGGKCFRYGEKLNWELVVEIKGKRVLTQMNTSFEAVCKGCPSEALGESI